MKRISLTCSLLLLCLQIFQTPILAKTSPNDDWLISDYWWKILSIAADPTAPQVIYAGSGTEGLIKSENRGLTWRSILKDSLGSQVQAFALSPLNSQKIIVGDINRGLFISSDGGQDWSKIETGLGIKFPISLTIAPNGTDVYAGTGWGVIKSEDGGIIWQHASNGLEGETGDYPWVHKIAISPIDSDVIYLLANEARYHNDPTTGPLVDPTDTSRPEHLWVTHHVQAGIYKSIDRAASWIRVESNVDFSSLSPSDIALHPTNPEIFFVGTTSGLYKTLDGGSTFQLIFGENLDQSPWVWSLCTDPVDPPQIYAGFGIHGIYRSVINSGIWEHLLTRDFGSDQVSKFNHISVYSLAADTEKGGILAGTETGIVFKTSDEFLSSDFDHNNTVDFQDFLLFAQYFGKPFEPYHKSKQFNLNDNGSIDFPDFLIFIQQYPQ